MDGPVEEFKREMESKRQERGALARALSRIVSMDGQSLRGLSVGPSEMMAREEWVAGTVEALAGAPTVEEFKKKIDERVAALSRMFPEEQGAPSRAAFKNSGATALAKAARMVDEDRPGGAWLWGKLAEKDPALSLSQAVAAAKRTAKLSEASGVLRVEDGLESQKTAMMERFGLSSIAFEGARKSAAQQSFLLDKMSKILERGARELGLSSETDVGMGGQWGLRVIDAEVNSKLFNQSGYVVSTEVDPVLGLSVASKDAAVFKHEWTHMLDAKLGSAARGKALDEPSLTGEARERARTEFFFSKMPKEVQETMPEAFDGYWQVAAAAQGMREGAALRALVEEREETFDALSRRVQSRLLSNPALMAGLDEAGRAELDGQITGPLKNLMASASLSYSFLLGPEAPAYDFQAEMDGAEGEEIKREMDAIAEHLEAWFGPAWRTGADGEPTAARERLAQGLNHAVVGVEAAAVRTARSMWGSDGMPLSPQSRFGQASHYSDQVAVQKGYWNAAPEMLARTMGRPATMSSRVDAWSGLGRKVAGLRKRECIQGPDCSDARAFQNVYAPGLDGHGQRMVREGFGKMTAAAGLGKAKLRLGAREWAERAMLSAPGSAALETAARAVQAAQRARAFGEEAFGCARGAVHGGVGALGGAVGRLSKGLGALGALGACWSGSRAEGARGAKMGHVGPAQRSVPGLANAAVGVGQACSHVWKAEPTSSMGCKLAARREGAQQELAAAASRKTREI